MSTDKTFLFTYNFDGARWQLEIIAKTPEEAQARINRLQYATYDGELMMTIPALPGFSLVAKFICWAKRVLTNWHLHIYTLSVLLLLAACSHSKPVPPPVPIPKEASTLSWDRDNASDIQKYTVYGCWTKYCTDFKAMGTVAQSEVGKRPEFIMYLNGKVGAVAVTAHDASNESVFSLPLNFDRRQ